MEHLKIGGPSSDTYITRENAKVVCFRYEGIKDINYEIDDDPGDLISYKLNQEFNPVISEFNKKLSAGCSEELDKHVGDDYFWIDNRHIVDNEGNYYPSEDNDSLTTLKALYSGSEYYFHPQHSENPEDHYRFIYSSIMGDEVDIEIAGIVQSHIREENSHARIL